MSDKSSRKIDDHSSSVKSTRSGHSIQHQMTTPNPALIPTYTLPTELSCHGPHHHITPYLTPSFGMPHPLAIQGTLQTGTGRPGPTAISNDLGPPIFMPSLNLGVPKSTATSSKTHKPSLSSSIESVPVSSPLSTPGLFPNTIICHTSFTDQSTTTPKSHVYSTGKVSSGHTAMNSIRKTVKSTDSTLVVPRTGSIDMSNSIGIIKQSSKSSLVSMDASPETSHVTYGIPNSQYHHPSMQYVGIPVIGGGVKRDTTGNKSYTDIGYDQSAIKVVEGGGNINVMMTLAGGGAALMCTEGVSTTSSLTSNDSYRTISQSSNSNHYTHDSSIDSTHYSMSTSSSGSEHIPWPEAMSKNIIIPAPNLTGRDIANLTSSASSPLQNDKGTNMDAPHWTSADQDPTENETISNYQSPSTVSNHVQEQSSFNVSSIAHGNSSPRPSILRKRPLEKSSDVLISPSISGHTLSSKPPVISPSYSNKTNLLCNEIGSSIHDNHISKDNFELSFSPRKRPRKQQFDSINDIHSPLSSDTVNYHKHSMIAHERLPGPLPLKVKGRGQEEDEWGYEKKEKDVLFISQLRKSPYPILPVNKKAYKSTHKHFCRHADIKNHEHSHLSVNEICNGESLWLRSSGWKLHHLNSHIQNIENLETDTLHMMEEIEKTTCTLLDQIPQEYLDDTNRYHIENLSMDTKERTKRSLLHLKETKDTMFKMLNANVKVVEIMKKFATHLPVHPSITSTLISDPPSSVHN